LGGSEDGTTSLTVLHVHAVREEGRRGRRKRREEEQGGPVERRGMKVG